LFSEDRLSERGFQCFPSSPQAVTYRAELHGTREATVAELVEDIEQWVQEGVSIPIQFQVLTVDASCDVSVNSFTDTECRASTVGTTEDTRSIEGSTVAIATTGVIVGIVAAGLGAITLFVVFWICKKIQVTLKMKDQNSK